MQYTINNVPMHVDKALRMKARIEDKTPNQVVLDAIESALGITETDNAAYLEKDSLRSFSGSWAEDPVFDKIIAEQDYIDPELWK